MTGVPNHTRHSCGKNGVGDGKRGGGSPPSPAPEPGTCHRTFFVQGVEAGMWEERGGWPRRPSPVTVAK